MNTTGIWPGIVVANNDPERLGRVKVRTPHYGAANSVYQIADAELPWAFPCVPVVGTGSGFAMIPQVGSGVWITFLRGNLKYPIWLGGWFGHGDKIPEHDYSTGVPTSYVIKTPGQNKIVMNDALGSPGIWLQDSSNIQWLKFSPTEQNTDMQSSTHRHNVLLERSITVEGTNERIVGANDTVEVIGNREEIVGTTKSVLASIMTLTTALAMTLTAGAAIAITAGAAMTITAVSVNIISAALVLGVVANAQKLCNLDFLTLFNSHTHEYAIPDSSSGTGPTGVPSPQAVEDTHTTTNVRAS